MPDGFFERFREATRKFIETLRKKMGLVRVFKIYMYEVRASGYVIPPKEVRKKTLSDYKPESMIQFELSFETEPFFRSMIESHVEARRRFEDEILDLVRKQEERSMERKAFSWWVKVPATAVPQRLLSEYLKYATPREKELLRKEGLVEIVGRPTFVVEKMNFTPVGSFEVSGDLLKRFEAIDTFIFKLYRTPEDMESDSDYIHWEGEFLHGLR